MVASLTDSADSTEGDRFSITDLCNDYGVTARALRFYEDEGLIAPERRGLTRIYSQRDRVRLAWILRGKRVGFSLADIREMIDLYDIGDGRVVQRQVTLKKCRDRIAFLENQRRDIDAAIAELGDFVTTIEALPHHIAPSEGASPEKD
jgi:DNA-binding transcriptional MerR regulator